MAFNENLIAARKAKGYNQEDLARLLDISRQAISKWETAESLPDIYKLTALADVLEVSIDDLCDRTAAKVEDVEAAVSPDIAAGSTGEDTSANTETPTQWETQTRKRMQFLRKLCAVVTLLGIGFLGGLLYPTLGADEVIVHPPLDVDYEVSDPQFYNVGNKLTFHYVPSVAGEEYTYETDFVPVGAPGEVITIESPYKNGVCSGETLGLHSGESYTVVSIISNGQQEKVTTVARSFSFGGGRASWF